MFDIPVGTSPLDISVNLSTNIIYVTNYDDNTVSVIDGKANRVITNNIKVGTSSTASVNPSSNIVYVIYCDSNRR
jgi:YVTN family beta-propeller protein